MHRNVVAVLALVAIAAAGLLWWAQQPVPEETAVQSGGAASEVSKPARSAGPSVSAQGAEIEQKDRGGKVLWKLKIAGTFTTDKNLGTVKGEDVQWDLMRAGQKPWRAVAPKVEVDYAAKRIRFASGVRVDAPEEAMSFEAGQVEYQMDSGKLICTGRPTMKLRGGYVRATQLVVDTQRRQVSARGVRAVYRP